MPYELLTKILSLGTIIADVFILILLASLFVPALKSLRDFFGVHAMRLSFLAALGATALSLFYSDVVGFLPCLLCWWQRIFLFPQVVILGIALRKKERVYEYTVALSALGSAVALYHTYIQFWGSPLTPCDATGISCAHRYFLEFGYVTIPTMSLTIFALILILSYLGERVSKNQ